MEAVLSMYMCVQLFMTERDVTVAVCSLNAAHGGGSAMNWQALLDILASSSLLAGGVAATAVVASSSNTAVV